MNVVAPIFADQPAGVSVVRDPSGLASFLDPACAAAIWDREVPSDVVSWPAEPGTGLLHRSPPIEGTGETRLVLVLDPIFELEEDA